MEVLREFIPGGEVLLLFYWCCSHSNEALEKRQKIHIFLYSYIFKNCLYIFYKNIFIYILIYFSIISILFKAFYMLLDQHVQLLERKNQ